MALLIENTPDETLQQRMIHSAFIKAAQKGNLNIMERLMKHADNTTEQQDWTLDKLP